MGAVKNLIMGFLTMFYYIAITIVIPLWLFSYIDTYKVAGIAIGVVNINSITFWIISFGLLISATAFFSASSPSRSKRKGIINIIQVILNTGYLYMYKFSGASNLILNITGTVSGYFGINLTDLVYLWMGAYALSLIIAVVNLLDYIFYKEESKDAKLKKTINETQEIAK